MSDNSTEIKDDKETLFDIEEELKKLPGKPGVYIMTKKMPLSMSVKR